MKLRFPIMVVHAALARACSERSEPEELRCDPAAAEPLPARAAVMLEHQVEETRSVFTRDLFNLFRSHCGGCHVEQSLGGFHVTWETFPQVVTDRVLTRMRSDQPGFFMPPRVAGGMPWSERAPDDPVVELATLFEHWLGAGRPADMFEVPIENPLADSPYLMSADVGTRLTNLGNCIPEPKLVAVADTEAERQALDAMFAEATELPERLDQTDLVTFDARELARRGVIAFAPGYPLWSDDARKIRHVRVPQGTSIAFDPATQSFSIPPNTRFYKTFLKRVVDDQGNVTYRKIETRVIVARPDVDRDDGTHEVTALFGTYAWNESETEAVLVRDPLRSGEPFRDRLVTVITDEPTASAILASDPPNTQEALEAAGVTRTYAIPGSERCIHCHMGSPSASFVLGFTPLQIARHPQGEHGVIEPPGPDELTQLDRLIAYGIVTGVRSADEIVPLEASQGDRAPRNPQELTAQAYMIGNCSHCHNPRGLPSMTVPGLRETLDFLPSPTGGIFQFPLDRTSPRIRRGEQQEIPIPYITPSLFELPVTSPRAQSNGIWKPKGDVVGVSSDNVLVYQPVLAPWRSLIYRNVDTPFTYSDHYAIFPHMPLDVPGYDCRAAHFLGEWMVSVPARRKRGAGLERDDPEPQPYEEVAPDDPDYPAAVLAARLRREAYQAGSRYASCPSGTDIVDSGVLRGERLVPAPDPYNVPDRPHWVVTDLTQVGGEWNPRRPDWASVLVDAPLDQLDPSQRAVVEMLRSVRLTGAYAAFALTELPFGLWLAKPECDFSSVPTVGSFTGDERMRWMDRPSGPSPSAPVYLQSPGAAVFTLICANCHGPKADGNGRLADTILTMTGGETRVANLHDGIFGPPAMPGDNRVRVFGPAASGKLTADDWASRYLVWMALGGTQRQIPPSILRIVSNTRVLGESRPEAFDSRIEDANMLSTARQLCEQVLPVRDAVFDLAAGAVAHGATPGTALITANGDAELWERLCTFDNPPPVRALRLGNPWVAVENFQVFHSLNAWGLYDADAYPADAPVGDHRGHVVTGVTAGNRTPWCIVKPTAPDQVTVAEQFVVDHAVDGVPLPFCPAGLFAQVAGAEVHRFDVADIDRWTLRGAANAGLAVFVYLDAVARGLTPRPPYDACERLP